MNWLWPQEPNDWTDGKIRAGRVLHWTFVVFAAPFIIGAAWQVIFETGRERFEFAAFLAAAGILVSLIGRGLRYVLSDE